jgi:hypothetical protein
MIAASASVSCTCLPPGYAASMPAAVPRPKPTDKDIIPGHCAMVQRTYGFVVLKKKMPFANVPTPSM